MMSVAKQLSGSNLVYLVRLKEQPTNLDAWYYVKVKAKTLVPIFLKKVTMGINLLEFGDILYSGWGTEPPDNIRQTVKKLFS
jgi:hypothetical protein